MKDRNRFYISAHGVDDNALTRIIQKAIDLENQLNNVSRIVFVANGLQNDGWLERQFGSEGVKQLRKGARLPGSNVTAKFESLKTYSTVDNEILITMGLESEEILLLDDNYDINAMIALPWLQNSVDKWAKIVNAINIDNNVPADSFANPHCVVIKALEDLTESINMSTGLLHPSDDRLAKTYLRTFDKYGIPLQETEIESYLIKQLNWTKEHTNDLLEIINKINNRRGFQGGDKTGLQHLIRRWKEECGE